MEDALVHNKKKIGSKIQKRLNPCFNGRCTRTINNINVVRLCNSVLILVLMEDALVLGI